MADHTLLNLNEYLFEQLDRLNNPELKGDDLEVELRRTSAVTDVAKSIISNADLALKAAIARSDKLACNEPLPKMLESKR